MRTAAASLAAGLIALLVYLATLCPTVFVGDSGELAWAAKSLGLAHPPGYPLWTLLGRVAVALSPAGTAVTLNAQSALFAAAAAALLALTLALITGRVVVSAGVAVAFALSRGVWSQATITEVYALNLLLLTGVLACACAGWRGRPRFFLLAAYLLGLGTANHPLVLAAAPAVLWLGALHVRERIGIAPVVGPVLATVALFVLGVSAYVYLPVRWSAGPEMNWGGIRSVTDLWDHVTRAQYGGLGEAAAETSLGLRLRVFGSILAQSVPGLLLLAGLFGLLVSARSARGVAVTLLLLFLFAGPLAAGAIRFEDTFLDRSVASVFFLPAVLAAYLAAGVGIAALDRMASERLREQGRVALLVTLALTALPAAFLYQRNASACDRSESVLGARYAEAVLGSMPTNARLYAVGDNSTFLFTYFQRVEGLRPDVTLVDRSLNLFVESYGSDFPALSRRQRRDLAPTREVEIAYADPDVPIFYTEEVDLEPFGGCRFVPAGLVNQLLRPGELPSPVVHEPFRLPAVDRDDFLEAHLAGVALYREGRWYVHEGRVEEAKESFAQAADVAEGIPPILRNLGLQQLELGDFAAAEQLFLSAVEHEPDNEDALYNLAVLYGYTGDLEKSLEFFERIAAQGTEHAEVYMNLGLQLVRAGRLEDAGAAAEAALALEPGLEPAQALREAVRRGLEIGGEAGALETLRAIEPVTTGGTLQLAARYLERGEVERASDLYREVYQKSPESVEAAYGLGYGLLRLGQVEEAAEAFRRVLSLDPESADGRNALAYVFALTGDSLDTAESLAREALELNPALAGYWYDTLGWVLYRAEKLESSLEALHQAAELLPPDDLSMRAENDYHIGSVLIGLGREGDARTYMERSVGRAKGEPWVPDLKARARELGVEVEST